MIQSSWNKTAAGIRPQSKLPFLRIMRAGEDLHTPFILFHFSPTGSLHCLSKAPSSRCCGNEQQWWPLTNRNQFLLMALWPTIIYISDARLLACTQSILCKKEAPHIFPEFSSFKRLLERNERLAWVYKPSWELGNASLFHLPPNSKNMIARLKEKIHLLHFAWKQYTHTHTHIIPPHMYTHTSTQTNMNAENCFQTEDQHKSNKQRWDGLGEQPLNASTCNNPHGNTLIALKLNVEKCIPKDKSTSQNFNWIYIFCV